jgi:YihY family inner membrane protein
METNLASHPPASRQEGVMQQLRSSMLHTLRRNGWSTLKYLGETEVHTYAFSVAANAILSFMPAAVLMLTVCRHVLHSPAMTNAVKQMLMAYLPLEQKRILGWVDTQSHSHAIELFSMVMLFVSCTGVFEPLEVALNSVWGFKSRNYLKNQIVSLGLAVGCGLLAFASVAATAGFWAPAGAAQDWMSIHATTGIAHTVTSPISALIGALQFLVLKFFGLIGAILMFFLIYWLLPNGKIAPKSVLPSAIITGIAFEIAQTIYMILLPLLDFNGTYGPFHVSVTLIFWAFVVGMLLLGGAHLSAQDQKERKSLLKPEAEEMVAAKE